MNNNFKFIKTQDIMLANVLRAQGFNEIPATNEQCYIFLNEKPIVFSDGVNWQNAQFSNILCI